MPVIWDSAMQARLDMVDLCIQITRGILSQSELGETTSYEDREKLMEPLHRQRERLVSTLGAADRS